MLHHTYSSQRYSQIMDKRMMNSYKISECSNHTIACDLSALRLIHITSISLAVLPCPQEVERAYNYTVIT